jgi:hypothetical protein
MFQAALAVERFEDWLRVELRIDPEQARRGVSLTWLLDRFLREAEGVDLVLSDYTIFLQMVIIVTGRLVRSRSHGIRATLKDSTEVVDLEITPESEWIESLSSDMFKYHVYWYIRHPHRAE